MSNAISQARVVQPTTAIIEGGELTRIGQLTASEFAQLQRRLFGNAAGVYSGLTVTATGTNRVLNVAAGTGIDANGSPIVVPSVTPPGGNTPQVTLAAGDATHPRIDVVYLQAAEIDGDIASIPTKASRTAPVVNQILARSKLQHFTIAVAQGTPNASPTVPAIPAGALPLVQVAVAAAATTISDGNLTRVAYQLPIILPPGPSAFSFNGVGHLPAMIGYDLDAYPIVNGYVITGIQIMCPRTPASGSITVELLKCVPGGSPTTLYTSNPLPELACNGGYAVINSPNLPNITSLAAGEILIARLTGAPGGAFDLKVQVI
jgi:hypothetical protein